MGNYHQTIVLGTVGSDPDMRYLQSGTAVTNFSVAVNEYWNDNNGERQEKTTWYRVNAWGRQAEVANEYVAKGMQIMVTGTVSVNAYTAQDGTARASLELKVQQMQFVGSRGEQTERQGDGAGYNGAPQEDIPFDHTGNF